jgi:hypothetical protein
MRKAESFGTQAAPGGHFLHFLRQPTLSGSLVAGSAPPALVASPLSSAGVLSAGVLSGLSVLSTGVLSGLGAAGPTSFSASVLTILGTILLIAATGLGESGSNVS